MAACSPICSSEPAIQDGEPGTVCIRQISTPSRPWSPSALRHPNGRFAPKTDSQTLQFRGLEDSYMTTADATRKTTKATRRTAPIIVLASVGRVYRAGVWATKSAAQRLGIEPKRLANDRGYVSIEQAEAIAEELSERVKAN
jgi:hypothetical protein